jgi:Txe/YoeB family toxin of Txe-Axe toxin-antitoxin module
MVLQVGTTHRASDAGAECCTDMHPWRVRQDARDRPGEVRSRPLALHPREGSLKGDRRGQHSIRINAQYRICFVWSSTGPTNVEIVDYH